MSCSIGHGCGLDLTLLWLWCQDGGYSSNLIPSLGTSICHGVALKSQLKKKKERKRKKKKKKKKKIQFKCQSFY